MCALTVCYQNGTGRDGGAKGRIEKDCRCFKHSDYLGGLKAIASMDISLGRKRCFPGSS